MGWTDEQQKVIDYRNRNILVSAAAGSGKTAVLVERIIKRITDFGNPVDIDRLLVVTFTNAAAAEMRERIGNAIEELLEKNPEDENLRKQQTLIHNAQITTIDSFCLFVVRNHFEEIGLDPNFRIADQGELKLLEMDVLDEVFEREYEANREKTSDTSPFLRLVDAYSDKRSNKAVKDMVLKIYRQSSSNPWPKEWIASLADLYRIKTQEQLLKTELMKGITEYVKLKLADMPRKLAEYLAVAQEPDGPQKYAENLCRDMELFEGLDEVGDYEELAVFCEKLEFGNLSTIRSFTGDSRKKDMVQKGRNAIKDEIKELRRQYFALSLEELLQQLRRMQDIAEELVRLSILYLEAMEAKKASRHVMDFSDIEHAALHILVDEKTKELRPTAMEFKEHFDEIMIDEYQDSNQVQEEIMRAISRESMGQYNMFMVGDVKQSIYRFRLARPELFMEKFATYDLTESKKQRIDLHKNFRSREEVLSFTNDIFYKIMGADLGNVAYDADAALYCGAEYPENVDMKAEVLLYEKDSDVQDEFAVDEDIAGNSADQDSMSNRQLEARMVAERIRELMGTLKVTDKQSRQERPLRYSDIVILLRGLKGWGNDFVSVLEDCGIPAHVSTSTGYFSAIEVQTVLSFLKILDNPYQDIPMAAVLKSAIVGLDNEELAELSLQEDTHSFAEAVLAQMETATEGKLYEFAQIYRRLRKRVSDTPIHQLIELVLDETGYGDYVKALPAGSQRKANLDMLVEKAISYEKTSYKGLFHFVRYIDQLQKYEVDFGEADIIGENEDVVRIMTIHKSKGLEFPVVFVSGLSKRFNESDSRDKMAIHPDLGLGLDEVHNLPRMKRKCLVRSEIANRIRRDNLGEELRVLYVALTRAKEKLILTGMIKNYDTICKKYTGNVIPRKSLSYAQRVDATCYLDWVAPAIFSYPDTREFSLRNARDIVLAEAKHQAQQHLEKAELMEKISVADADLTKQYREAFAYEYPYKQEEGKKSKYSVSELKHDSMVEKYDRLEGEVEVPEFLLENTDSYIPEFARSWSPGAPEPVPDGELPESDSRDVRESTTAEKLQAGALRGTAVHRVMAGLDFKQLLNMDIRDSKRLRGFLEEEIHSMVARGYITEEMEQMIYRNSIIDFLSTPVARRMAEAHVRGDLYREKPFVMDYEGVLLQGIIDVFWLEDDRIVLLDYKTDKVEQGEELLTRYATQLQLYAKALKKIFSTKERIVDKTENYIYSLRLNELIEVEED